MEGQVFAGFVEVDHLILVQGLGVQAVVKRTVEADSDIRNLLELEKVTRLRRLVDFGGWRERLLQHFRCLDPVEHEGAHLTAQTAEGFDVPGAFVIDQRVRFDDALRRLPVAVDDFQQAVPLPRLKRRHEDLRTDHRRVHRVQAQPPHKRPVAKLRIVGAHRVL